MGHLRRTAAAVGGAIVLTLGSVSTGHAAQSEGNKPATAPTQVETHCVATAAANTATPVVSTQCFDTFAKSVGYATGGKVKLAPGQRTVEQLPSTEAGTTVVGIEYEDTDFGGSTLVLSASTSGFICANGMYVNFPTMPSGWNEKVSSARSYSGCKSGHSWYTNNQGLLKICGCASMGSMNDNTSSIRFSASGT